MSNYPTYALGQRAALEKLGWNPIQGWRRAYKSYRPQDLSRFGTVIGGGTGAAAGALALGDPLAAAALGTAGAAAGNLIGRGVGQVGHLVRSAGGAILGR